MKASILGALIALALVPHAAEAKKPKGPFYALVNADGTMAFGNGLVAIRSPNEPLGVYWVYTDDGPGEPGCIAVGTTAGGFVGTVSIGPEATNSAFRVTTSLGGGAALFDMPFYLVVSCPKQQGGG